MKKVLHDQKLRRIRISNRRLRERRSKQGKCATVLFQISPKERFVKYVQIWDGDDPEEVICVRRPTKVPENMCLDTNLETTLEFVNGLRHRILAKADQRDGDYVRRKSGRKPVIMGYADFSSIRHLSTATALMLAAEYDRIRALTNKVPPAVNIHEWSLDAFAPLYGIGFFTTVGISPDADLKVHTTEDSKTMHIVTMEEDDNRLAVVDGYLEELYDYVFPGEMIPESVRTNILTSVSEALANVADHAYEDPTYPYLSPTVRRSWVTASASRASKSMTVVVFDQGAGIPFTYPKQKLSSQVKTAVQDFLSTFGVGDHNPSRDDAYIEAAMRYGNSRTGLDYRGKGLPQMSSLIDLIGDGRMSVYSGNGWWRKSGDGRVTSGTMSNPVGGTLIDWTIQLGAN